MKNSGNNGGFDKIDGNRIFLNGAGKFPKIVVISEEDRTSEYRLLKTKFGKFQLIK